MCERGSWKIEHRSHLSIGARDHEQHRDPDVEVQVAVSVDTGGAVDEGGLHRRHVCVAV